MNRLHSVMMRRAVWTSFSGQQQYGEGVFYYAEVGAETAVDCSKLSEYVVMSEGQGESVEDGGNE